MTLSAPITTVLSLRKTRICWLIKRRCSLKPSCDFSMAKFRQGWGQLP